MDATPRMCEEVLALCKQVKDRADSHTRACTAVSLLRQSVVGSCLPSLVVGCSMYPAALAFAQQFAAQLFTLMRALTQLASAAPTPAAPTAMQLDDAALAAALQA